MAEGFFPHPSEVVKFKTEISFTSRQKHKLLENMGTIIRGMRFGCTLKKRCLLQKFPYTLRSWNIISSPHLRNVLFQEHRRCPNPGRLTSQVRACLYQSTFKEASQGAQELIYFNYDCIHTLLKLHSSTLHPLSLNSLLAVSPCNLLLFLPRYDCLNIMTEAVPWQSFPEMGP